jgi:bifunctional N-acetylglucosamine-1-phosphate-uridyltransferase/glucosamine-1-phosphate-acetyltransferase GlmU-like protein
MDGFPETFDLARIPEPWRHLFEGDPPWAVLARLDAFLAELAGAWGEGEVLGDVHPSAVLEGPVRVDAGAHVAPHAHVRGPAWLMAGAEVGHGATVRGGVLVGPGAKVGHATEVKRSVLLPGAKAPHFNYVGDSVVGSDANLGAGVKLANLKTVGASIVMAGHATGLRKLGSWIGDGASIGCNAVLAPGTVVGAGAVVYATASVRGVVPARSIVKVRPVVETVPIHD